MTVCATCLYKQINKDGGWCYMFVTQPQPYCLKHKQAMGQRVNTPLHTVDKA